jgi:hypothetical protein
MSFFKKKIVANVQTLMECGSMLAASIEQPYSTRISFDEDEKTRRSVAIAHFTFDEIPSKFGFARRNFVGLPGYCHAGDEKNPSRECEDSDRAAFHQGTTWFLGQTASLDDMARNVARPNAKLGINASALSDAAAVTEGFNESIIQAQPKSSKSFFEAPCTWGAMQTAGSMTQFMDACFPKTADKLIETVDAHIRAAAFETDDDVSKAGQVHGNIVFVARDNDAAEDVEREAREIVAEWSSHASNNETKILKQAQETAITARQKRWHAVADTFLRAIGKAEVKRKGRVVRVHYAEKLAADDRQELADADATTLDRRIAVAQVLDAIEQRRPLPEMPLAKLVGKPWATYLINAPQQDEAASKSALPESECSSIQQRLASIKILDLPTTEARTLFIQQKFAECKTRPPEVTPLQRGCLLTFRTAGEFAKCVPGAAFVASGGPVEPPESEFGDRLMRR